MAKGDVRYTERSYMAALLERDPDFYADRNRQVEYEFGNGRKFIARPVYSGYGPQFSYGVVYRGARVTFRSDRVTYLTDPI